MKILSVENLEKSFGDLQVLKDISLEVNHGEIVSIICLLYTSPSPRDRTRSRMPSSA